MLTPQEVASHSFAKATLGGYNLAQVDEFLDALTEDYAALYNENAILKNKLKVLSDTVEELKKAVEAEEYRLKKAQESTAAYVRKLAAAHDQEMAFLSDLGQLVPPEQLAAAKDSDPSEDIKAALTAQISKEEAQQAQPAPEKPAPRLVAVGPDDDVPPMPDDLEPLSGQGQDEFELDPDATRRYSDLQFGKDYEIQ